MITEEFRKTTGFAESPSDSVSQSAIISFNANSMFFSNDMTVSLKSTNKILPIITADAVQRSDLFL
jgi:hypothetical protein